MDPNELPAAALPVASGMDFPAELEQVR